MSALPYCAYFSLNEILNSYGFIICVTLIIYIICVNSMFYIIIVLSVFCITYILCIIIEMILKSPYQFRL